MSRGFAGWGGGPDLLLLTLAAHFRPVRALGMGIWPVLRERPLGVLEEQLFIWNHRSASCFQTAGEAIPGGCRRWPGGAEGERDPEPALPGLLWWEIIEAEPLLAHVSCDLQPKASKLTRWRMVTSI